MIDIITHNLDLHMHSTISDGTDTPRELVRSVCEAGVRIFSLTDHDALEGCIQIKELLEKSKPDPELLFINGVEFSCKDELGKYHILGYRYDDTNSDISDTAAKTHEYRMEKVRGRIQFLDEEYGFKFSEEDLTLLYSRSNPGKPHIGNLMTEYGYAPDKDTAITEYINNYHGPTSYLRPEEAIQAIHSAGGIPVLAHPYFGDGSQQIFGTDMENRLLRLMDMGIMGVEAFYSGFSTEMIRDMLKLADCHNLYVTAGSDYHGSNKTVPLKHTGFTEEWTMPAGMKRFLQECL